MLFSVLPLSFSLASGVLLVSLSVFLFGFKYISLDAIGH